MRRIGILLLLAILCAAPASGLTLSLQGDRITLQAQRVQLTDVLRRLALSGVEVRTDPRVQSVVSGDFVNARIDQVLELLLDPYGYVLIWDVVEGPLGSITRLGEIQVFVSEDRRPLQPLPGLDGNLRVTRGPLGELFAADEILLGFREGARIEDVERMLAQIGGTIAASIPELGVYQVHLPPGVNIPALAEQLAKNPLVAAAEPNFVVPAPTPTPSREPGSKPGEMRVPEGRPPEGAAPLALLDSGLMGNIDLADFVVGRLDALNPDRPLSDAVGHGTHMALIAAGAVLPAGAEGSNADGVPLLAIRAFDDNGMASNFSLMRSLNYAASQGARVANMSWGTETPSEFLRNSIAYAQSKGMLVVAAAGNEPTGRPVYPAAFPGVIAVAATEPGGSIWEKSNYGNFVFVSAPGTATLPAGGKSPAGAYAGTSIAGAYVSRTLAQYFARNPNSTASQAVNALKSSLTQTGSSGRDAKYGYGILDSTATTRFLK